MRNLLADRVVGWSAVDQKWWARWRYLNLLHYRTLLAAARTGAAAPSLTQALQQLKVSHGTR